jgi:hypothetical protein
MTGPGPGSERYLFMEILGGKIVTSPEVRG